MKNSEIKNIKKLIKDLNKMTPLQKTCVKLLYHLQTITPIRITDKSK